MKSLWKTLGRLLLWGAVAGYVAYAAAAARSRRAAQTVQRVEIEALDSTAHGSLISVERVRQLIARQGIPTVGVPVAEVDLERIEQAIAGNGFVSRVVTYLSYDGVLHVGVSHRDPLLRLMTDGVNSYVTPEGYLFPVPASSSLYVPVVTGSYRPPVPADYSGDARAYADERLREVERRIEELELEKYPFYQREIENERQYREVRRKYLSRSWWRFERADEFEAKVEQLRKDKAAALRRYRYQTRLVEEGIDRIVQRQEALRAEQKKIEKNYQDFMKLLTFVEFIERDDFWRSEVVQIIARTAASGALEVDLIPRSGNHCIRFGRLERVESKLDKLMRFYRNGLPYIGWDGYAVIDIRYADRVICSRR